MSSLWNILSLIVPESDRVLLYKELLRDVEDTKLNLHI